MTDIITRTAEAIKKIPLSISSTRRGGENGLRNPDEVAKAALRTLLDDEAVKGLVEALAASCTALKDTAWVETHNDGKKALTAFQQLQQQLTGEPK